MSGDGHTVVTGGGRRLRLGPLLKSGGAGSIHRLPESPHQVAKLYHRHVDHAHYERKLAAMLALSPQLPDLDEGGQRIVQIAWPQDVLRDARGRFAGFLMPVVDIQATSELETVLQERQARAAGLPTGLGAKITLAANLAAVVAELHRQGHHVVDLKPVNLRFYPRSLYMAMLDCDGFSIQGRGERFHAPQFTPDYLAPEFQFAGLDDAGEETQDRFALAAVVFQLLNFGLHPYSGRPANDRVPTDLPGRIAQRCYPYGLRANGKLSPSAASSHESWPTDLRQLFDRAFEGTGSARPAAQEWAQALRGYAQRSSLRLVACGQDPQHQHFAGRPCAACQRGALLRQVAKRQAEARAAMPAPRRSGWHPAGLRRGAPAPQPAPPRPPGGLPYGVRRPPGPPPPAPSTAAGAGTRPRLPLPRNPSPPPAPPLSSNLANGIAVAVVAIFFAVKLLLASGRQDEPPRDRAAEAASRAEQRAAPERLRERENARPATAPSKPPASATEPTPSTLRALERTVDTLAISLVNQGTTARADARGNLRRLSRAGPRSVAFAPQAPRPALLRQLERPDPPARIERRDALERALADQPGNAEAAFELGWLALHAGDRGAARERFLHALWADHNHVAAWYGYGFAAGNDPVAVGAMAHAELLMPDEDSAGNVRALFGESLASRLGDRPGRTVQLQARAQRVASIYDGRPLSPETEALARQPLPPK